MKEKEKEGEKEEKERKQGKAPSPADYERLRVTQRRVLSSHSTLIHEASGREHQRVHAPAHVGRAGEGAGCRVQGGDGVHHGSRVGKATVAGPTAHLGWTAQVLLLPSRQAHWRRVLPSHTPTACPAGASPPSPLLCKACPEPPPPPPTEGATHVLLLKFSLPRSFCVLALPSSTDTLPMSLTLATCSTTQRPCTRVKRLPSRTPHYPCRSHWPATCSTTQRLCS